MLYMFVTEPQASEKKEIVTFVNNVLVYFYSQAALFTCPTTPRLIIIIELLFPSTTVTIENSHKIPWVCHCSIVADWHGIYFRIIYL